LFNTALIYAKSVKGNSEKQSGVDSPFLQITSYKAEEKEARM
jgi:hypothetical protein